jgi:hypothetical protein
MDRLEHDDEAVVDLVVDFVGPKIGQLYS